MFNFLEHLSDRNLHGYMGFEIVFDIGLILFEDSVNFDY